MKVGQLFTAQDDFELYGLIRSSVSSEDFIPEVCQIFHFIKISHDQYKVDASFKGQDYRDNKGFLSRFPDGDIYCGLDATGTHDDFTFSSKDLFASVVFTDLGSWTATYEDHLGNPVYDEYMIREARIQLINLKKAG